MTYSMKQSDYISRLQAAILTLHGIEAVHVSSSRVHSEFEGIVAWDGYVETFELIGHPITKVAFAWGYEEDGELKITTVLGIPPVDSPSHAVDASIVAKAKQLS